MGAGLGRRRRQHRRHRRRAAAHRPRRPGPARPGAARKQRQGRRRAARACGPRRRAASRIALTMDSDGQHPAAAIPELHGGVAGRARRDDPRRAGLRCERAAAARAGPPRLQLVDRSRDAVAPASAIRCSVFASIRSADLRRGDATSSAGCGASTSTPRRRCGWPGAACRRSTSSAGAVLRAGGGRRLAFPLRAATTSLLTWMHARLVLGFVLRLPGCAALTARVPLQIIPPLIEIIWPEI